MSHQNTLTLEAGDRGSSFWSDALKIGLMSLLIALVSRLAVPLPFSPVPLTLQTPLILFFAAVMGSKRTSLAVILYLAEGAVGFPVFAAGGGGLAYMAGPTGGYLVGWVLAAFVTGYLFERKKEKNSFNMLSYLLIGSGITLFTGWLWLSRYLGFQSAFFLGVLPFLLGDLLKSLLVAKAFKVYKAY